MRRYLDPPEQLTGLVSTKAYLGELSPVGETGDGDYRMRILELSLKASFSEAHLTQTLSGEKTSHFLH